MRKSCGPWRAAMFASLRACANALPAGRNPAKTRHLPARPKRHKGICEVWSPGDRDARRTLGLRAAAACLVPNLSSGSMSTRIQRVKKGRMLSTARLWGRAMNDSSLNAVAGIFTFLQLGVELAQYSKP